MTPGRGGAGRLLVLPVLLVLAVAHPADLPGDRILTIPESRVRAASDPVCANCNVLLVSMDTLRPDHLGCYGYERPTSPEIDRLCDESVRFDDALSNAPSTLPSHASMFTSLLPRQHGASRSSSLALSREAVTLAETLRDDGFATAAFVDGGQLDPAFGLDQGFDLYASDDRGRFAATVQAGLEWLGERESEGTSPFFLFLHSYQVHLPYFPPEADLRALAEPYFGPLGNRLPGNIWRPINDGSLLLDRRDLAHLVDLYDAEIRSADRAFGALLDGLRDLDLYESTLLIFLSDHGEEFGEHGGVAVHAYTLHDEVLRIPWIVKFPFGAFAGSAVEEPVSLLDLFPTILETVAVRPPPAGLLGRSLLGLLTSRDALDPTRAIVSQQEPGSADLEAIQTRRWKWYDGRLYSRLLDPGEHVDLTARYPGVARTLRARLESSTRGARLPEAAVRTDKSTLESLRALGYIR